MCFCKDIGGEGRYTNIHPLEMMLSVSAFLTGIESLFCQKYEAFA